MKGTWTELSQPLHQQKSTQGDSRPEWAVCWARTGVGRPAGNNPHPTPASCPSLSPAGYVAHCLPPSGYDGEQKPGLELAPAEPAYPAAASEEYSDPESPQSSLSARYFRGEAAVTDSYSMDAFFISDGRSRRRRAGAGGDAAGAGRWEEHTS